MKSKEYFKFVVSKIENDLKVYSTSGELLKCLYLLSVLKNTDNPLKDIYTISRIKNFKNLGNYLLFILKKTETGEVRFDNLIENLNLDKEFILNEMLNRFDVDSSPEKISEKEETPKEEKPEEESISGEIKRILAESHFKVEEIDNELVTEEFIESEVKEDNDLIVRGNYLELLQPEAGLEEESVFALPTDKQKPEAEEENNFLENDVFTLPGEKAEEDTPKRELVSEQINTEELEEIELTKITEKEIPGEIPEQVNNLIDEPEEYSNVNLHETEEHVEELIPEETEEEIPQEEIPGKAEFKKEEIPGEEEIQIELPEEEEIIAEEKDSAGTTEEPAEEVNEEINENAEITEVENSVYMQYETELISRNAALCEDFEELIGLDSEKENFADERNIILNRINENSSFMEEYSKKMSFEVITSIYNVMYMTFSSYGKTVGSEIIALFKKAINLVESLIKGEDFIGFDNVIKSLETLKNTLIDSKKEEDRKIETTPDEKEELGMPASSKYLDTNQRQKLVLLKQNILDIENVFKSLDDIKGKFQAYEALRRLSHTFAHLKELVSIANTLEIRKLAQLAEASYIFVKFIQNYRMNPFESEITEVFKYIIYNFKLIFLDKPTKDIDLLISYLNDPVKIFEKKEKK